jgi:hypothetical protein
MGLGYQVDANRRNGGHGGYPTGWEFSTRAVSGRVKTLQGLELEKLVSFHFYLDTGGSEGFCILQEEDEMAFLCFRYMTMWPDVEAEAELLRQIQEEDQRGRCLTCRHLAYNHLSRGTQCDWGSASEMVHRDGPECPCIGFKGGE